MACSFCIHLKTPCFNALGSCGLNGGKSYAKRKSLILLKQNCTQQFAVGGETHCLLRLRLPVDTSLPHREQTSQRPWRLAFPPSPQGHHLLSWARHSSRKELSLNNSTREFSEYKKYSCGQSQGHFSAWHKVEMAQ